MEDDFEKKMKHEHKSFIQSKKNKSSQGVIRMQRKQHSFFDRLDEAQVELSQDQCCLNCRSFNLI